MKKATSVKTAIKPVIRYFNKRSLIEANEQSIRLNCKRLLSVTQLARLEDHMVFPVILHVRDGKYNRLVIILDDEGSVGVLEVLPETFDSLPVLSL